MSTRIRLILNFVLPLKGRCWVSAADGPGSSLYFYIGMYFLFLLSTTAIFHMLMSYLALSFSVI